MNNKKDFFISYTKNDEKWAEWIAWQLENKEYKVVVQAWDFKPGTNFVNDIHNELINCERFIAVVSPDYFKSLYCQAEWTAAFTKDPSCEKALFVPVRIRECRIEGLLATVNYIDLNGIEETEAIEKLLIGISKNRPINRPGFPGTSNKPRFPGQLPFNNLPFRQNPNFTGREKVLSDIRKSFNNGQYISLAQSISGLGGIGKTQIALEYAFRYGYLYDTIWWVSSESSFILLEAYLGFAQKYELVDKEVNEKDIILESVLNWMSQHKNWLFIYDNVDEYKSIYKYLPTITTGHILITSRNTNWYRLGEVLSIDVFEPDEAEDFMIKSTGNNNRKGAVGLVEKLGYLPLALEQASAFIVKNKITYEKYIELFEKYKLDIFEEDGYESNDYSYTVAITWNVSIEKIDNEISRQLINIFSFLAPENITKNIFIESNKYLPEPLASVVLNELKFNKAISDLAQYSLIRIQDEKISIHRLLQEVIRKSLDKKEGLEYCLNIINKFCEYLYNNPRTWKGIPQFIPHALSVVKYSEEVNIYFEEVTPVCNLASECLICIASYEEAEALCKRALKMCEKPLRATNKSMVVLTYTLGKIYFGQGRYGEAESLYKRALENSVELFGVKHRNTAPMIDRLALLYFEQGRYEEAESLYKRALEIMEELLGVKHIDISSTVNNLALLYYSMERYEEAESLYKRAFKIIEDAFEEEHPNTACFINNLALLYYAQEKYEESEPLYKRALEIREEVLGEKHPETATTVNNLALLYYSVKRYEEAELFCKRALGIREEVLGEKHPDTANSLNLLAQINMKLKIYEEVGVLFKRAFEIREKILGMKHFDTINSLEGLTLLYHKIGRYEDAESLVKKLIEIKDEVLGTEHPDTAEYISGFAKLYYDEERYEKAEPLFKRVLQIKEKVLGANHPDIITSLDNLGATYFKLGRVEEMKLLKIRVLEISEEIYGIEHPNTATALSELGLVYQFLGIYSEAEASFKWSLHIRVKILGGEHPDTIEVFNDLIRLYYKYEKVEELMLLQKLYEHLWK